MNGLMSILQMLVSNLKKEKQKIKPTVSYPKLGGVKPSLLDWIFIMVWQQGVCLILTGL